MSENSAVPVFAIDQIPVDRGAVVLKALENYDQKTLLQLTARREKFPLTQLLPAVETATRYGVVRAFQVRTPIEQVLQIVDLNTFQQEMDSFVQKVASHELKDYHGSLLDILDGKNFESTPPSPRLRQSAKTLLYHASANGFSLKLLELFWQSLDDFYRLARASIFSPIQVGSEFKALLQLLHERRPQNILEIGTANGGTLYLFTKAAAADATLVSVDLKIKNEKLFSSFNRKQQKVILVEGDSTASEVKRKVREIFGNGLDFLFIDGDHSYEGVKADFQNYFPHVKPGGIVAFHDIVESYDTRFGLLTEGWAGGVPQFWNEIKKAYDHREFVENWQQDGFGIGVLFKPQG
jgi:cephalosporin hydroxylase